MSGLPPRATDGVFAVQATALIDAPREKVWSVLLDFPSYTEWNPFVREQMIVDKSKKRLDDQTPAEGKYLHITRVHIPPTMDHVRFPSSAFEMITTVDHENYRVAWINLAAPKWILNAERWQSLTVTDDGKTKYETIEVFGGIFAYLVKFFVGAGLNKGFHEAGQALKRRSEE
ncbi:hypothetical protein PLICRDRAFT_40307 [Plicaturopsis crispa FD-325 SS-3]|nr:hypothetical protein PLICRDRAFT_40307 [Plicaturopsis crispa FD-325 SS-3]